MKSSNAGLDELNLSKKCAAAWNSLAIGPGNEFGICCEMIEPILPNGLPKRNLSQILKFHPSIVKIRSQMKSGTEPDECLSCFNRERVNADSARKSFNIRHFEFFDSFDIENNNLKFLEIRLGNLCQLECVMCNPQRSIKLDRVFKKLSVDTPVDKSYKSFLDIQASNCGHFDDINFVNNLAELCKGVTKIYFNGGEPLLSSAHEKILDQLILCGASKQISLTYSTNGLLISDILFDRWKNFKHVNLVVSIDDLFERNHFIRFPTNWEKLEQSLLKLKEQANEKLSVSIWSTLNFMSFFYAEELIDYFKSTFPDFPHMLRSIQSPGFLSPGILPKDIKTSIVNKLGNLSNDLRLEMNMIENTESDETLLLDGIEYLEKIANLRNLDLRKLFPKFYESISTVITC